MWWRTTEDATPGCKRSILVVHGTWMVEVVVTYNAVYELCIAHLAVLLMVSTQETIVFQLRIQFVAI